MFPLRAISILYQKGQKLSSVLLFFLKPGIIQGIYRMCTLAHRINTKDNVIG